MKRSEMIKELMKFGEGKFDREMTDEEVISAFLDEVEKLGMLPPAIKDDLRNEWEKE